MIVTLTVHPALDRTLTLTAPLRVGEVQSAVGERVDPAGKGVNVARVIRAADVDVIAVLPLDDTDPYAAALATTALTVRAVPVVGRTRTNLTIADADGTTTKVNLPGVAFDAHTVEAVIAAVVEAATDATWLVLAGSLPPGAPHDLYARVIDAVRAAGHASRIAVDTSGPALDAVIAHGGADLIKPNDDELGELTGDDVREATPERIAEVAAALVPARVSAALITLGSRGAVLVTADGAWFSAAPRITARSTVGAGDSSLAGFLLAAVDGADEPDRLTRAVRYGAAAAMLPGTQPPRPSDLPSTPLDVRVLRP